MPARRNWSLLKAYGGPIGRLEIFLSTCWREGVARALSLFGEWIQESRLRDKTMMKVYCGLRDKGFHVHAKSERIYVYSIEQGTQRYILLQKNCSWYAILFDERNLAPDGSCRGREVALNIPDDCHDSPWLVEDAIARAVEQYLDPN